MKKILLAFLVVLLGCGGGGGGGGSDDGGDGGSGNTPPVAAFTGSPLSGTVPLSVQFASQSTGDINSHQWDADNDGTVDGGKLSLISNDVQGQVDIRMSIADNDLFAETNVGTITARTIKITPPINLDYTIFRLFNTYGPLQSDDFVITKFIKQAIQNNDLTIYGDGLQTRTFCFIEDNLEATISSIKNNIWVNDVVNIGSDIEMTIVDLAKVVIDVTKSKSKIVHLPALKEGDMTRRKPEISKMMNVLGRDLTKIEDGIRLTAEFIQKKK